MDCQVSGLTLDHRLNHSALLMSVTVSLILFLCTICEQVSLHIWNDRRSPRSEMNLHLIARFCSKKSVMWVYSNSPTLLKSKSTPLLTIINASCLAEHYSSVYIYSKKRQSEKKCLFCHRCGLLGNAYSPPRCVVLNPNLFSLEFLYCPVHLKAKHP